MAVQWVRRWTSALAVARLIPGCYAVNPWQVIEKAVQIRIGQRR